MSSKKLDTVWKAEPHTVAKIELLGAYLRAWFSILGTKPPRRGAEILYVDGFAGPGEYTNHPTGSPVAAIEAATSVLGTHSARWLAGDVFCAFIDQDPDRITYLKQKLDGVRRHARIHVSMHASAFVQGLNAVRARQPRPFSERDPLFVFIDPFGATGVPFGTIAGILDAPCSEVLINLDADGIARIFQAGADANRDAVLTDIFGDESWRTALSHGAPFDAQCRQALDLYKRRLRTITGVRYVFAFEMRGKTATLNYFLVFASRHHLGLEKMKEAMRSIDQTGGYAFSDADIGQSLLFRFDDPADFARKMFGLCKGRRLTYGELRDYALNETPFVNPKKMLKYLEDHGLIQDVRLLPGKQRRKGTFSEDAVAAVVFARGEADA
jgi:three-Cys-motif partner protein